MNEERRQAARLKAMMDAVRSTGPRETPECAEWPERVGAKFVDYCIAGIPAVSILIFSIFTRSNWFPYALAVAVYVGYSLMNLTVKGTLGKRLNEIELVRTDGTRPTLLRRAIRWLIQYGFFFGAIGMGLEHQVLRHYEIISGSSEFFETSIYLLGTAAWIFYVMQVLVVLVTRRGIHDWLTGIVVGMSASSVRDEPSPLSAFEVVQLPNDK